MGQIRCRLIMHRSGAWRRVVVAVPLDSMGDIAISWPLEATMMTNILIRGLSESAVGRIDGEAATLGLSRNEFLRRRLEQEASVPVASTVSADEWRRSEVEFGDLADPDVIDAAWRLGVTDRQVGLRAIAGWTGGEHSRVEIAHRTRSGAAFDGDAARARFLGPVG